MSINPATGNSSAHSYTFAPQLYALPTFSLTGRWPGPGTSTGNTPLNPAYRYQWSPPQGTWQGTKLPDGIYTYRIRLSAGETEQIGTLRLLR